MKERKTPMRRCIGCMQSKEKNSLIRIAGYEGELTVDLSGKAKGRGVYICKDKACLQAAEKRKAIERSLGISVTEEKKQELFNRLEEIIDGR